MMRELCESFSAGSDTLGRDTDSHTRATQQTGKAPPTMCDGWKLILLWRRVNESHSHILNHTLTHTHAQSCLQHVHKNSCFNEIGKFHHYKKNKNKSPATFNIAFQWGISYVLTVVNKTYSLIHFFSKLPSPQECPAGKDFSLLQ